MTVFNNTILPLLNDYKTILRKNLPLEEANTKIKQLQLKRKKIQHAEDIKLYRAALNVIDDIQQTMQDAEWSSKIVDFMQHIQNILNEYQIENNRVIHPKQQASRALMDIIQLIRFPNQNYSTKNKIQDCIQSITQYGTPEQCKILKKIINSTQQPQADKYEK